MSICGNEGYFIVHDCIIYCCFHIHSEAPPSGGLAAEQESCGLMYAGTATSVVARGPFCVLFFPFLSFLQAMVA